MRDALVTVFEGGMRGHASRGAADELVDVQEEHREIRRLFAEALRDLRDADVDEV
jgi:hypothetical protein